MVTNRKNYKVNNKKGTYKNDDNTVKSIRGGGRIISKPYDADSDPFKDKFDKVPDRFQNKIFNKKTKESNPTDKKQHDAYVNRKSNEISIKNNLNTRLDKHDLLITRSREIRQDAENFLNIVKLKRENEKKQQNISNNKPSLGDKSYIDTIVEKESKSGNSYSKALAILQKRRENKQNIDKDNKKEKSVNKLSDINISGVENNKKGISKG